MLEDLSDASYNFMAQVVGSSPVRGLFIFVQAIFILASFVMLVGIVWLLFKSNYYGPKMQKWHWWFDIDKKSEGRAFAKEWTQISTRLQDTETNFRDLILDSTNFMEQLLSAHGYEGGTLEEQLAHVTVVELPSYEDVSRAARKATVLRDDSAIEASFMEAEMVIGAYDAALRQLHVIN